MSRTRDLSQVHWYVQDEKWKHRSDVVRGLEIGTARILRGGTI